jgi:hypothetical protein
MPSSEECGHCHASMFQPTHHLHRLSGIIKAKYKCATYDGQNVHKESGVLACRSLLHTDKQSVPAHGSYCFTGASNNFSCDFAIQDSKQVAIVMFRRVHLRLSLASRLDRYHQSNIIKYYTCTNLDGFKRDGVHYFQQDMLRKLSQLHTHLGDRDTVDLSS